ncbi:MULTISPECIES: alpha/beta fold hydrolase [Pseudomonas]|uniref:alpha/beta fold hydrolase n=1 Tax=Pseudomonas TaxID=286 RepID=UPI00041A2576|nr:MULTISPECIES: alpha/beta fold hydrolase [Pseudomonas]TEK52003.1 alpha/beta fold hydrolase [Pseudomonas aeruginosa]TEK52235.1 alpha/beta fold hydrolase [Pseudomonas aeruginosa]TEK69120.1 alpha/beta fold hydrolase [Pseudomonas aeruginosa]TEK78447.1 alpha/beta fold hydrolase [Pseudomonas aeruginosa]TEK89021.1 alpha/beta fold hydrolase [Pseudomonas aeruginosa]
MTASLKAPPQAAEHAPQASPELGREILAAGWRTNLLEQGSGFPLLLIHGSGPGVTAWANWRLVIPQLAQNHRVLAPDMLGFGYSERPADAHYSLDTWVLHALGVLDVLGIQQADLVGNSFGGAIALALAVRHPERVRRLVLMGSVGVPFELTPGLDAAWGYRPSLANMRALLDLFACDRGLVSDDLAELRYQASIRPGLQESFAAMFPAPRQRWIEALCSDERAIRALPHPTMVVHGREDQIIPLETSLTLAHWIPNAQLHVYGHCGHWTQIEHAGRFARLVEDFLAEAAPLS